MLDSIRLRAPALDAARSRARAARGERLSAGSLGNPMLMYQVENTSFPGAGPIASMSPEHMITATLPMSPLYQRSARVAQANARVRAAYAEARATGQLLALNAARAYYRSAIADITTDAADDLAHWLDSLVVYNRTRVEQGVAAEVDLVRAEVERDRALADASMQAAESARARAELAVFLGEPNALTIGFRVAVVDTPLALPPARDAGLPSNLPNDATMARESALIDRRPDIIAERERLSAARAGTLLESRMRFEDVGATFGIKATGGTSSMIAGFSLPMPLFDVNRGGVARARAERDAVASELEVRRREARAELLGAQDAARILTERTVLLARRDTINRRSLFLARADEARAITLGAYREGAVPLLQVLDAARARGDARLAYFRTLYAQHEAVLALIVARGDDLVDVLFARTPAPTRGSFPR
ncbi:MAG: TolC family protein [Gemmatimonadaceae bacterium]